MESDQSSATDCAYNEIEKKPWWESVRGWKRLEEDMTGEMDMLEAEYRYASASPLRNARSARTSVTYCKASSMGMRWRRSLSVGSLIQPSIGIALSTKKLEWNSVLRMH